MTRLGPGPAVAVIDVGGTETKYAVVDDDGAVLDLQHVPTPRGADVVEDVLSGAAAHVRRAREQRDVRAVGMVVPGIVDATRGLAIASENLGWRDVPFHDLLAARVDVPVGFGHDVATAGRAEVELGAAAGATDAAVVVIGTGIAAALVSDGRPVLAGGWAGELGHSVVDPAGPHCVCGARGCLEAIASTAAIARRYADATGRTVDGSREVLARATDGDPAAVAVWETALDALAAGLRQLAAIVAPRVVVLGGGLSGAGEVLRGGVAERLDRARGSLPVPELRLAAIGVHGGLVGAALLARDAVTGTRP